MDIIDIREKLIAGHFEFSRHALQRVAERNIRDIEIREAGRSLEMLEAYPTDKYSPSCLLLGFTSAQRPLHLQVCYSDEATLKIVTIYEPSDELWSNFRIRRQK